MNFDPYIDARRAEMIHDLQELIRIESVAGPAGPGAPFGAGVRAALDFVLARARAMGLTVYNADGYAGHAELGEGGKIVGILSHLDVVPAGDGWTYPPFGGELVAGRIYGRGAVDDKGPVIACLYALAALREAGFHPAGRLRLILGGDEEGGSWESIKYYFRVAEKPAYGFSPDADFPVINAEKGHLWISGRRKWPGKPARGGPVILAAWGGTRPNVVPDFCRLVLAPGGAEEEFRRVLTGVGPDLTWEEQGGELVISARGRAAHASLPERGKNAIGHLFTALVPLAGYLPPAQAEMVRFLAAASRYDGKGLDLQRVDGVSGALTVNLGTLSWDENEVVFALDIRYPVTADGNELTAILAEKLAGQGMAMKVEHHLPPLYFPAEHPLVATLLRVFREKTGQEAAPLAIGGRTFACALPVGVAFGPVFPGRPELAHQADEYIEVEELILAAKIYAAAMAALTAE